MPLSKTGVSISHRDIMIKEHGAGHQKDFHIGARELTVPLFFAQQSSSVQNTIMCFHLDNKVAVHYIVHKGSPWLAVILSITKDLLHLVELLSFVYSPVSSRRSKYLGRQTVQAKRIISSVVSLPEHAQNSVGLFWLSPDQQVCFTG